jgi:hypothetical protein
MPKIPSKQIEEFSSNINWEEVTKEHIPNTLDVKNYVNSQIGSLVLENKTGYYQSINESIDIDTTSPEDTNMISLQLQSEGIYSISFNSQYLINATDRTAAASGDMIAAYQDLMSFATTETTTPAIPSRTFNPGVYSIAAAGTIAANIKITLDGNGTYIFKFGAAFSIGADVRIILINGASASDIFWIAEGAVAVGANCNISGNLISHSGAVDLAAGCFVNGRLLAINSGAISISSSIVKNAGASSSVSWGLITSFVFFTTGGVISNAGTSTISGDIGTRNGSISTATFISPTIVNGEFYTSIVRNALATFSIYSNGILSDNSSRSRLSSSDSTEITLQGIVSVLPESTINIKWRVDSGQIIAKNRILTAIKII